MTRWHESSCRKPIIQVDDDNNPYCKSCGCRCLWRELVASNGSGNANLNIPESGPSGQINLRWPPSVQYTSVLTTTNSGLSQSMQEDITVEGTKPPISLLDSSPSHTASNKMVYSPIYGDTLASDELRLACLSAAEDDGDYPLHLSLEVFKDDNCPEYETVSYTWGGEDGDYSLSRPIFVGPFWDIVFQTKNAWDMLRFIRPWRGTRMIWVDALCINQGNVVERGQQVAKMGRIYELCLRVIVYLGSDLVLPLAKGTFPTRCRLSDFENGSIRPRLPAHCEHSNTPFSFRELLKRQYFSRIWVIQELLLSQRTVIRIGDVDFWTDSSPWPAVSPKNGSDVAPQWDSMQAPWIQYLAQKSFPVSNTLDVLQKTCSSRASDPRDRIFGLLGLIRSDDVEKEQWQPDYSLTPQHVFTGLFAHCIINLKRFDFLFHALGHAAPIPCPSWVPDWSTAESWQGLFVDAQSHFTTETVPPKYDTADGLATPLPLKEWVQGVNFYKGIFDRPWDKDIAIHAETGALSLNLTRFCSLPTQPTCVAQLNTTSVFEVRGKNRSLYLASKNSLATIVNPSLDHIFILVSETLEPVYLILRDAGKVGTFRLIATCTQLLFFPGLEHDFNEYPRLLPSVHSRISNAQRKMESSIQGSKIEGDIGVLFPGTQIGWDLLPVLKALLDESSGSTAAVDSAILSCIGRQFHPRFKGGYLEFEMPMTAAWSPTWYETDKVTITTYASEEPGRRDLEMVWSWRLLWTADAGFEWRSRNTWIPFSKATPGLLSVVTSGGYRIRVPLNTVRSSCDKWVENIACVKRVLGISYNELEDMLRRGPKDWQHCIACPSIEHQTSMEDFRLDIQTDKVLIL